MSSIKITNLKGDKGDRGVIGPKGEQGLPGVNAIENDAAVAAYVKSTSATRTALASTFVQPGVARVYEKLSAGRPIKIAAIGDSILEGNTTTTPGTDDCLSRVAAMLSAAFGVTVSKGNYAVSGRTIMSSMRNGQFAGALSYAADLYIISFGKNDYRSDSPAVPPGTGYPTAAHLGGLEHMIRRIRTDVPFADIIILSENPDTDATSSAKLLALAKRQREVAAYYGCTFADGYKAFTDKGNFSAYMYDGVHPNSAGHQLLADTIMAFFEPGHKVAPTPPQPVPLQSMFGAHRYTQINWTSGGGSNRLGGRDGGTFVGTGWNAASPFTSAVAGDVALMYFSGTEIAIMLNCGAGQGTITIDVDGQSYLSSVNLAALESGTRLLPITGLDMGPHLVAMKVLSGSVTYTRYEYLKCPINWISASSPRITYTGSSWSLATSSPTIDEYYGKEFQQTEAIGATIAFDFIGTGFGMNLQRNAGQTFNVSIDGAAPFTVDVSRVGSFNYSIKGSVTMASGLKYGRHSVVITTMAAATRFGGVYSFDESRTARPQLQRALARVGDAVTFPIAYTDRPYVSVAPADGTSTVPPIATAQTASGFTVAGTAGALVTWEAEGETVAY